MNKTRLFLLATLIFALLCTSFGVAEENLTQWAMEEPVKVTIMHRQNPAVISYAEGENEQNNVYFNAYRDQLGIELDYRIRAVDEYGNTLYYSSEPIVATTDGPVEILCPSVTSLKGGMGGIYVKTIGERGRARLIIGSPSLGNATVDFIVR